MSEFNVSFPLINELFMAFRRNSGTSGPWTPGDIKKLSSGNTLSLVHDVIRGLSEIKKIEDLIDCDTDPFVPSGWKIVRHCRNGLFQFSLSAVRLYLNEQQETNGSVSGEQLSEELKNKSALNTNVLDWLLANPKHIPEEWKKETIFFWGTIYHNGFGDLCVRALKWDNFRWDWVYQRLCYNFYGDSPAALRAA